MCIWYFYSYRILTQPKAFMATMQVVGRVLAAILTLTACYIHALTIKHAVTPKFWHGFHPKQP